MGRKASDVWEERTPYGPSTDDGQWPVRVDSQLAEDLTESDVDSWIQSVGVPRR